MALISGKEAETAGFSEKLSEISTKLEEFRKTVYNFYTETERGKV